MSSRQDVVADRFVIEESVGSGGSGRVFRARDLEAGASGGAGPVYRSHDLAAGGMVALKLFDDCDPGGDFARFSREVVLIASLGHPHIVRYVAHYADGLNTAYLAMEWLAAPRLHERLRREELTMREAVDMAVRVAHALGKLHALGLVHGTVRPENLFLPEGDPARVKLSDPEVPPSPRRVRTVIKPALLNARAPYLSPEQTRTGDADARADVFALGAVLFRCLTGRQAFVGETGLEVMTNVKSPEPAPRVSSLRPEVPRALCDVVAAMLAKKAVDRPADGNVVMHALAALGHFGKAGETRPSARETPE